MTGREISPGVAFEQHVRVVDVYEGSIPDLLAAGVVEAHQLPGAPGNGLTMVTFFADGRRAKGGNPDAWKQPGYMQVRRIGRGRLSVTKGAGPEEEQRRRPDQFAQQEAEQEIARCWPFAIIAGSPV